MQVEFDKYSKWMKETAANLEKTNLNEIIAMSSELQSRIGSSMDRLIDAYYEYAEELDKYIHPSL
jgi:hypothetical protein